MAFWRFRTWPDHPDNFAYLFSPFAFLLGLPVHDAMYVAQLMGMKLATNEFVAMLDLKTISNPSASHRCGGDDIPDVLCNFSTVGMIYGTYNSILDGEKSTVIGRNVETARQELRYLYCAAIVGLFVW